LKNTKKVKIQKYWLKGPVCVRGAGTGVLKVEDQNPKQKTKMVVGEDLLGVLYLLECCLATESHEEASSWSEGEQLTGFDKYLCDGEPPRRGLEALK
jgi:hypothetical protein